MSILTQTRSASYVGNGATHTFAVGFPYMDSADIVVTIDGVTKVPLTDFEVVGTYPSQSIHFIEWILSVKYDKPPVANEQIHFERSTPVTQPTAYRNQGQYFAKTHESSFDRLCMIIQDLMAFTATLQTIIVNMETYQMIQTLTTITETEVLLVTSGPTALPTTPMTDRLSMEIQNNGPNAILVGSVSGTLLRTLQPKESWTIDYTGAMWGKALTANQVTGAATVVTEGK